MKGKKFDNGKAPISLIPHEFIKGVAEILSFGASKYGPYNWAEGLDWSRVLNGIHRHIGAWESGENNDPETNKSHILHATCGMMFLYMYQLLKIGKDDRWQRPKTHTEKDLSSSTPASTVELDTVSEREMLLSNSGNPPEPACTRSGYRAADSKIEGWSL